VVSHPLSIASAVIRQGNATDHTNLTNCKTTGSLRKKGGKRRSKKGLAQPISQPTLPSPVMTYMDTSDTLSFSRYTTAQNFSLLLLPHCSTPSNQPFL
jgi:hypothetical protein